MKEKPVTPGCVDILAARDHAVIGISPFNSYFSEEKIAALIAWAKANFNAFHIYVPDGPSRFTLEAIGYKEARARKKARRQARWLFNKIRRGLAAAECDPDAFDDLVLCSASLDENHVYRQLLRDVDTFCSDDPGFHQGCKASSQWVLSGHVAHPDEITPHMLEHAVLYFKAELPLFMNSPRLVDVRSSVFVYHQCPGFLETLLHDKRGEIISADQGFVVVTDG